MNLQTLNPGYVVERPTSKSSYRIRIPRSYRPCLHCRKDLTGEKSLVLMRYCSAEFNICFTCYEIRRVK